MVDTQSSLTTTNIKRIMKKNCVACSGLMEMTVKRYKKQGNYCKDCDYVSYEISHNLISMREARMKKDRIRKEVFNNE